MFAVSPGRAQTADEAVEPDQDFELPGAELADTHGDGGFELGDASAAGNPLKNLVEKWPEDLVIAPVPGRSPQLGWNLSLVGGRWSPKTAVPLTAAVPTCTCSTTSCA
jgi:hypothetical protein